MKKQSWLSIQFFSFFFTWGVFVPYWTAWLVAGKQFSVYDASTLIAISFIVRSISTFFAFPYLSQKQSLLHLARGLSIITLLFFVFFWPFNGFFNMLVIIFLFSFFYPMMMPLTESAASLLMKKDGISYGKSRLWGSVGYTLALLVTGAMISFFTESSIYFVMLTGCVLMMIGTFLPAPSTIQKNESRADFSYRDLFFSKEFMLVLLVCILIQGSHASYYNYGVLYLQELHVSGIAIGIILNLAVLAEIVFFSKSDAFFLKVPISLLLLLASTGAILRWTLVYAYPDTLIFICSQVLHAVTFGVAHYAFIRFISEKMDPKLISSAQGIYASIGMGLSTGLLSFLGGHLYAISPGSAFLGMAVVTIPCFFLSIFLYVHYDKTKYIT
ncbi:3-phenylpropionate MFS transporter [Bacillus sp. 2205SS5-2]|uniref:3-phenylpropionate MFS transporter n=1 Tax=Bacillus sp. 2205SS5-2 TaxID=3109031 RepID=UPI003006EF55